MNVPAGMRLSNPRIVEGKLVYTLRIARWRMVLVVLGVARDILLRRLP